MRILVTQASEDVTFSCEYLFLGENYSDREPEWAQFAPAAWSQHCDLLGKPRQST